MCLVDAGADGEVLESDMRIDYDMLQVLGIRSPNPVVDVPDLRCRFCGTSLRQRYSVKMRVWVYDHSDMDDLMLSAKGVTADNFCPNNAKIWILEPDMVTLREI